jgi:hypothetical protein
MAQNNRKAQTGTGKPSLRGFNPDADRNGQNFGQDSPLDVARPDELQRQLNENPGGEAETARLASGRQRLDSTEGGSIATSDATAAESAPGAVERLSDASLPRGGAKRTSGR